MTHKHLILFFVSQWCEECSDIEKELEESYWLLEELGLHYTIGKIDITNNKEIAKKYNLQGVPSY